MEVREARTRGEVEQALALRLRVFCEEQGVDRAAEQDGRDDDAIHLVALQGGELIGTCRLLVEGGTARLGRNAVSREARGRGVGATLLEAADRAAVRAGADRIRLHAQLRARTLYERSGYAPQGDAFLEQGIEHVTMEKPLA
ncbi:MAG TPA: GNAT family N-acetyltransferase [Thermoleophilaceae bacterium]|nr:GNAT family N-acetyltransferase [Thermoleophilaceae bacterium]